MPQRTSTQQRGLCVTGCGLEALHLAHHRARGEQNLADCKGGPRALVKRSYRPAAVREQGKKPKPLLPVRPSAEPCASGAVLSAGAVVVVLQAAVRSSATRARRRIGAPLQVRVCDPAQRRTQVGTRPRRLATRAVVLRRAAGCDVRRLPTTEARSSVLATLLGPPRSCRQVRRGPRKRPRRASGRFGNLRNQEELSIASTYRKGADWITWNAR